MAGKAKHRFSVYERGTDRPIIIYGLARECAEAMGITEASFWKALNKQGHGDPIMKYEIFKDDFEEDE